MQVRQVPLRHELGKVKPAARAASSNETPAGASNRHSPGSTLTVQAAGLASELGAGLGGTGAAMRSQYRTDPAIQCQRPGFGLVHLDRERDRTGVSHVARAMLTVAKRHHTFMGKSEHA